jgi:1-acyl-sn-glycerol-3-phosphate acyltransferase
MESWSSYLWYEFCYLVSMTAFTLGSSLRTVGRQNVPAEGPALIIANHQSYLDPVLIGLSCRRHLCYLARKTLFRHSLFRLLIRSLNAVPIDQDGVGKEGIKAVLEQLHSGRVVVVFPEGERTGDGKMQTLKPGVHLLIKRAQVPVVPIGIAGAFRALPRWRRYPHFAPLFLAPTDACIAIAVGEPLAARRFVDLSREQVLDELFRELQKVTERAERLRRK